jgi:hypothetical protein
MPYLGDYLGQLMAEIAIARMQADLETVRLAEIYAAHPLLKTMAVPRLRLPEVDLELPVLIERVEEPPAGAPARGGVALGEMRKKFDDVLSARLKSARIAMSPTDKRRLKAVLDDRIRAYGQPRDSAISGHLIADELTTEAVHFLQERPRRPAAEARVGPEFASALSRAVRLEFLKLRPSPPRLVALVTTAEIQAVDSPESVTRFRVKLNEQGVEWTTIESQGVERDRLVPE